MKRVIKINLLIVGLLIILIFPIISAEVIFQDDFENGLNEWEFENNPEYTSCTSSVVPDCSSLGNAIGISNEHSHFNEGFVDRNCPGSFSDCGSNELNDYLFITRGLSVPLFGGGASIEPENNERPLLYKNISTSNYENVEVFLFMQIYIERSILWDYTNLESGDAPQLVYRFNENDPWTLGYQWDIDPPFYWLGTELSGGVLDNKPFIQIGLTFSSPDDVSKFDQFFIDDFQVLGDIVCGNGIIDPGEECEFDTSCPASVCNNLDRCYSSTYRNYQNIENSCLECTCSNNACNSYIEEITDNDEDGYDIECDNDCDDSNPFIYPGAIELCNNLDDNCNGNIDENLENITGITDRGACEYGLDECQFGEWIEIIPSILPSEEICDYIDNDCDNEIDEGCDCVNGLIQDCGSSNIGECKKGIQTCSEGEWGDCVGNVEPVLEVCDNLDNDCDGGIDENYVKSPTICGIGVCANTGWLQCVNGIEVDSCNPLTPSSEICDDLDNNCNGLVDEDGVCNICEVAIDCGEDKFIELPYCMFNDSYQNFISFGCVEGDCENYTAPILLEDCGNDTCEDFEDNYCKDEKVYHDRDCYDKGCSLGSCFTNAYNEEEIVEDCGQDYCEDYGDNYCKNNEVYHLRVCYDKGCALGNCFTNPSDDEELIEECDDDKICEAGVCEEIDIPINLIVNSPIDGKIYSDRRILLDLETSEIVDEIVYTYLDSRGREREVRLCRNCDEYNRERSFSSGWNNLTFKAIVDDNPVDEENVSFFIDYKDPRISKTSPTRGFSDGNFYIEFREDNPKNLTLYYGNGIRSKELDIEEDCDESRGKYSCSVWVNLSDFDNKEIEYRFELEDIVGNQDESRKREVDVDMTKPVINNPDSFWEWGTGRYSSYMYFDISITEINFDEVVLSYDYRGRTREKKLCSRLRYGSCEKKFRIRDDYSNYQLIIRDDAGNEFVREMDV